MDKYQRWFTTRRKFITESISIGLGVALTANRSAWAQRNPQVRKKGFKVRTDFAGGGGTVEKIDGNAGTIRFKPHNERAGGWSQVWWYFKVEGVVPGEVVTLMLNQTDPAGEGVAPQAYWSYDQTHWEMTAPGEEIMEEQVRYVVYNQRVRSRQVWFAYNIPYLPEQSQWLLNQKNKSVTVQNLCLTKKGRPVYAIHLAHTAPVTEKPFQVWLQARAHAFESGASWVLHELTLWLLSDDPFAKRLRATADITIVPIIDVDGVVEGRTGKDHIPHDQNRDWDEKPSYWPEVKAIKKQLQSLSERDGPDLFIDIHGPGNATHPYFICPLPTLLRSDRQRENQSAFLSQFENSTMTGEIKKTQSMDKFYHSLREINQQSAAGWVGLHTGSATVAVTLEVNMLTTMSTAQGYQKQGRTLGAGIARYFSEK